MRDRTIAIGRNGRCSVYTPKPSGDDLLLEQAVGKGAAVEGPDVLRLQQAVNRIPRKYGGPARRLPENGRAGRATIRAIEALQERYFAAPDGRVEPMSKLHARIGSLQPAKVERMQEARQLLLQSMTSMLAAQAALAEAAKELADTSLPWPRNLNLAEKHFDIERSADPAAALLHLGTIYTAMLGVFSRPGGLWGWQAFEPEPFSDPETLVFTREGGMRYPGQYAGWQRLDAIYIGAHFDRESDDYKIRGVIHAIAHFVGDAGGHPLQDYGYGQAMEPGIRILNPHQKQHNADSLANYAFEAKFGRPPQ